MLNNRIKEARTSANITLDEMAKALKIGRTTLIDYEKGKSEPKVSVVIKMSEICTVGEWWLLTGKGEMHVSEPTTTTTDNYTIDMLNVRAGAGKGIYNYEVEVIDKVVVDSIFFKQKPDLSKLKIIAVDGDSMEPNIKDGSYVIIDESKTSKVNGIYALLLDDQLLIKRLQFMLDGTVKIISDNSKYETELYNPKDTQISCSIIGRKVLTIQ